VKQFLRFRSRCWGHDGWCLRVKDASAPMQWTMCSTRAEARELKAELESKNPDLFHRLEPVKVKLSVEVAE